MLQWVRRRPAQWSCSRPLFRYSPYPLRGRAMAGTCRVPRATAANSRYECQCTSRQSRNGELPGHSSLLCSRTRSRQALRLCDRKLSAVGSHGLAARHVPGNAQIPEIRIQWAAAVPRANDHRRCRGMILLLLEKARVRGPFVHAVVVFFRMFTQLILYFGAEASEVTFPVWHPNLVTLSITRPHCV